MSQLTAYEASATAVIGGSRVLPEASSPSVCAATAVRAILLVPDAQLDYARAKVAFDSIVI